MLTRDLGIAAFVRGKLLPDRLTTRTHAHYVHHAERLLDVYQSGIGRTRRELHQAVHQQLSAEPDCPLRRIGAFCKLLDEASEFDRDSSGKAARLRQKVFQTAAMFHPLVQHRDGLFEHEEAQAKTEIARQIGRSWEEIDAALFADVIEFHRLRTFPGYPDAAALLSRYNVAQVQVALFDAVEMVVRTREDFKAILRYAKLARLMHTIRRLPPGGYEFRFDGPASALRETRRYGIAMARFLPGLLACRGWELHALLDVRRFGAGYKARLDLSPAYGLRSPIPTPDDFDSDVESAFAERWGTAPRDGWSLIREGEVLHSGQKVFVPDFVFQHQDGRRCLLEIIGFWTPEYLQAKMATLQAFAEHPILIAVAENAATQLPELPARAIRYKTALALKDVLGALEQRARDATEFRPSADAGP